MLSSALFLKLGFFMICSQLLGSVRSIANCFVIWMYSVRANV